MGFRTWLLLLTAFVPLSQAGKKVFCYFSSSANARAGIGRFWPENIDPYLCTHLIFAFADIAEGGRGLEPNNWNDLGRNGLYMRTHKLKEINPKLKLILAVGGWRIGSLPFLPVIETLESMEFFAGRVVTYLRHYGFDGMDMDWEFPGIRGSKADDKMKFTELMKTIQRAFEVDAVRRRSSKLILTMAAAASKYYAEIAYEQDKIWRYVDYVLLMTYNYHGANWENVTGHHSALLPHRLDKYDDREHNFIWSVEYWLRSGIPPEKLCVGLATYGISFKLEDPKLHGVRAPVLGPGSPGPYTNESGIMAYYEICDALEKRGWQMEWIDDQYVPYAHGQGDWVGFENPDSLVIKMNDVLKRGLGGVLVWSVEMDDFTGQCNEGKYPLLRAINNVLKPTYDTDDIVDQREIKGPQRGHGKRKDDGFGNIKKSDDIILEEPKAPQDIQPEKETDRRKIPIRPEIEERPDGTQPDRGFGNKSKEDQRSNKSNGSKERQGPKVKDGRGSKESRRLPSRKVPERPRGQNEMANSERNDTRSKLAEVITTELPTSITVNDSLIRDWNPWITQQPPPRDRYPNGWGNRRKVLKPGRQHHPQTPSPTSAPRYRGFDPIRLNISDGLANETESSLNESISQQVRNSSRNQIEEINLETTTTFDNFEWPESISNQTEEERNSSSSQNETRLGHQHPNQRPGGMGRQFGEYEHKKHTTPSSGISHTTPDGKNNTNKKVRVELPGETRPLNNTSQNTNNQNITVDTKEEHNSKQSDPIINDSKVNQSKSLPESAIPSTHPESTTRGQPEEIQIPEEGPGDWEDSIYDRSGSDNLDTPSDYSWYDYWESGTDSDWSNSESDYPYSEGGWYGYGDEWYSSNSEDYYYSDAGELQEEEHTEPPTDHADHYEYEHSQHDSHEGYEFDCNEKGLGIYKDPTSCTHFIMCVPMTIWHLGPLKMDCPMGTRFDDDLKVCNFEHKVHCSD